MASRIEKPRHVSQAAWDAVDVPEMTDDEFAEAKPFADLAPALHAAWKQAQGDPAPERSTVDINFRLAADLVEQIKATGRGYNARVEKAIREALAKGSF